MEAVRELFRPEFLNRLDDVVLFRRLAHGDMSAIVDIQLQRLRRQLADQQITLEMDATARAWLANAGFDPTYGARPLRRVIQRNLHRKLSRLMLEGAITEGSIARVTADTNGLHVKPWMSPLQGLVRQVSPSDSETVLARGETV